MQTFYTNTFIEIAPDCPVTKGEVPPTRGGKKSIALLEYELLSQQPYHFNQHELIFEVHWRHKGISEVSAKRDRQQIWDDLFKKPHPCMRASALPKRYGWGVHYDEEGRIAIYAVDSKEYTEFVNGKKKAAQVLRAIRSKRP